MRSEIIYCPHLNRDIRGLLNAVPDVRIATGLPTPQGHDGCLESHKDIIRRAQRDGEPFVFVMEDDCEFTKHFKIDRWLQQIKVTQAAGFDLLVGGCVNTYEPRKVVMSSNYDCALVQVAKFHSAHCIVYMASSYKRALQAVQPWDVSLCEQGLSALVTWPFVAIQRPVFSGILNKDVDYTHYYKAHEQHLGEILNLHRQEVNA